MTFQIDFQGLIKILRTRYQPFIIKHSNDFKHSISRIENQSQKPPYAKINIWLNFLLTKSYITFDWFFQTINHQSELSISFPNIVIEKMLYLLLLEWTEVKANYSISGIPISLSSIDHPKSNTKINMNFFSMPLQPFVLNCRKSNQRTSIQVLHIWFEIVEKSISNRHTSTSIWLQLRTISKINIGQLEISKDCEYELSIWAFFFVTSSIWFIFFIFRSWPLVFVLESFNHCSVFNQEIKRLILGLKKNEFMNSNVTWYVLLMKSNIESYF